MFTIFYFLNLLKQLLTLIWQHALHRYAQKLLSVLLALGFWYVATGERRTTIERTFIVQVQEVDGTTTNAAGERRSITFNNANVRATLSGPRNTLQNLTGDEINASVNVTDQPEGDFQAPVHIRVPEGLRLVRVSPSNISGFIDTEITRTLPIQISTANLPKNALPHFDVIPSIVRVIGSKTRTEAVTHVYTVPVTLARSVTAEVRLIALDASGYPVTDVHLEPASVAVKRTDRADLPLKTIRVILAQPPSNLEIVSAEIDPPNIQVIADQNTLARLSTVTARVNFHAGRYSTIANLDLPTGARSLDAVTVTLNIRERTATP